MRLIISQRLEICSQIEKAREKLITTVVEKGVELIAPMVSFSVGGYIDPSKNKTGLVSGKGTSFIDFHNDVRDSVAYSMGIPRSLITDDNINIDFHRAFRFGKGSHVKPRREPQIIVDSRTWTGRY